jgi:A/G-specific adenine glycosylase
MGMKRHQNIAHEILNWYAKNARDLPWRKTEDPYNIWVSEVMLQQTQVSRVIDYYARFLNKFPTVHHLAKAEWDDFLPVWRGLGFYSRGKNMLRTGKIVAEKYAGVFPQSKKELESLPGIGPYTASAILSFAHKKPEPAIDTNLLRVFQRVFGCTEKGVLPRSKELFLSVKDGHRLNHAIMDIGSILIVSEIHRAHKKRIRKDIPLSSTYNLLHRHNWRKIAPRPSHPKGDEEKREEYKALVFPPTGDKGKD